jgi:hypothetical protein
MDGKKRLSGASGFGMMPMASQKEFGEAPPKSGAAIDPREVSNKTLKQIKASLQQRRF